MKILKPLDTAPLEQDIVLVWKDIKHLENGKLYKDGNFIYHVLFDGDSLHSQPTHWCELPEGF